MPNTTRRVPGRQQRALRYDQSRQSLFEAEANLQPDEYVRYEQLLAEAGNPENLTDRAAILDRAKEHVAAADLIERERGKTEQEHRDQLWGRG